MPSFTPISTFGDKIRNISLSSLTSSLKNQNPVKYIRFSNSQNMHGKLEINIVEGRNLTIVDASNADTYCIVYYEGNVTSTLNKVDDELLPSTPLTAYSTIRETGAFQAFEIMMGASSPKWMHRVSFDVNSGNNKISLFVYDRGNRLLNGEDRFLGMSSIVPNLVNKKTVELTFPLKSHPDCGQEVTGDIRLQVTYTCNQINNLTPDDFRLVRMIGQGSIGKVYEVVKSGSNRIYAMKVLSKRLLVAENEVEYTLTEHHVLGTKLASPFISNLRYSFQTTNHLYLVTDYYPGGDLFDFLESERCLNESHCQFFAAEIVCAFDSIHVAKIIYRNLRPESILLDAHGHLALTDFGFCKELENPDEMVLETPKNLTQEYLAPEMLSNKPYGKAADWWSLGILMFELLTGYPPFHSLDKEKLFDQILHAPIEFPLGSCITDEAKDFVHRLLERDPTKRLGSHGDAAVVKSHSFFSDVNWDIVYKKQMQLPFVPEIEDTFTEETTAATDIPLAMKPHVPFVTDQSKFIGFSFIRDENKIKGIHRLNISPEDEDPEIDFWFRD